MIKACGCVPHCVCFVHVTISDVNIVILEEGPEPSLGHTLHEALCRPGNAGLYLRPGRRLKLNAFIFAVFGASHLANSSADEHVHLHHLLLIQALHCTRRPVGACACMGTKQN